MTVSDRHTVNTLIVGAGAAGLAVGACLKQKGKPFAIIEAADKVGSTWRNHYDRLHLHTDKKHSELPHLPYPKDYPRYPSRDQLVRHLETYADHFKLEPKFGTRALSAVASNGAWETETSDGTYLSSNVVFCTGYSREPVQPSWPGMDTFRGEILHSSAYRNGSRFAGRRVLVVGFGNSGGEIAIDLCEHQANTSIAVRSPVNVIPRELFGLPILALSGLATRLPARISDRLNGVFLNRLYGDLEDLGFRKLPYGPLQQVQQHRRIPLIDIGTIDLIREGRISVRPGLKRFNGNAVVFDEGFEESYDAIVLATGYRPHLAEFLPDVNGVLIDKDRPVRSGAETAPGLFFCGLYVSPGGMLQQINKESRRIADLIAGK